MSFRANIALNGTNVVTSDYVLVSSAKGGTEIAPLSIWGGGAFFDANDAPLALDD